MKICGLQKTTLLDYPGHVAATVFLGGCNFRCPFCHNSALLGGDAAAAYTQEEILLFLKKRSSILEGVCVTGGEPTVSPDLESFIEKIQAIGLQVKLDTNGFRPQVLKSLCQKGLLDYVAMDIKASRETYALAAGTPEISISHIEESVEFLKSGDVPYEFRTTVVKGLHTAQDFGRIGPWLSGCSQYFLQNYQESPQVLNPVYTSFSSQELSAFADILRPYIPNVQLRGVSYE